jgi:2-(3-amino-3-carboxypropyl)histidine synthase
LPSIKKTLESHKKTVLIGKGKQPYAGQVLGCDVSSALKVQKAVDAFLFLGDGTFHPAEVMRKTGKPVYRISPATGRTTILDRSEVDALEKKRKAGLVAFHTYDSVGVLVSTKDGQRRLDEVQALKKRFPKKEFFVLAFDTLDYSSLKDFPFIKMFVNTACPRMVEDYERIGRPVINIEDI